MAKSVGGHGPELRELGHLGDALQHLEGRHVTHHHHFLARQIHLEGRHACRRQDTATIYYLPSPFQLQPMQHRFWIKPAENETVVTDQLWIEMSPGTARAARTCARQNKYALEETKGSYSAAT
jgi:hypothetical protein